jgi:uncharacterized protein YgbK (DUF1537 family)
MIAVIADDIAGAAELAGAAFLRGLTAEVHTEFDPASPADVIVVDTDSRSLSADEAARRVAAAADRVRHCRPQWVFKKVDSVLRGNVLAEVTALQSALGKARALLVPANPSLGRIVRGGRYFVDGRPLDQTDFAADPEHPAATSEVLELLGASGRDDVCVLRPGQPAPAKGTSIGEAAEPADVAHWARQVDPAALPAGGVDFFAAMLDTKGHQPSQAAAAGPEWPGARTALFLCGSAAAWARSAGQDARSRGIPIIPMPADVFQVEPPPEALRRWAETAGAALEDRGAAMVTVGRELSRAAGLPQALTGHLARLAERLLQEHAVDRLFVEGGATASAVVRRLQWSRLPVCGRHAPSVVAMQVSGRARPVLTIKPGSYPWPEAVWKGIGTEEG